MGSELVAPFDHRTKIFGYDGPDTKRKFGEVDRIPFKEFEQKFPFLKEERKKKRKPLALSREDFNEDDIEAAVSGEKQDDLKEWALEKSDAPRRKDLTRRGKFRYNANHFRRM